MCTIFEYILGIMGMTLMLKGFSGEKIIVWAYLTHSLINETPGPWQYCCDLSNYQADWPQPGVVGPF